MPEDAEILETAPGKCRKCGMVLKPVRLDIAYSCARHPFVMHGQQGICPVDKQPLVRITASVYWTCAGKSDVRELTPGKCADGTPRVQAFERLAHGDHNPRHGGQFFMADDNWHHIEGTHPARDTFRVFFYDDYTRPIAPAGFSGRAIVLDTAGKEIASVPLKRGRVARTLEAKIPPSGPARVKLMLRFRRTDPERVFDFAFQDITKEPVTTMTKAAPAAATPAPAVPTAATPAPVVSQAAGSPGLALPDAEPATAAFLSGAPLPETTEGLIAELTKANVELQAIIERGEFGVAWVSALRGKDAALELEQRSAILREARPALTQAIKQLVISAFQIDAVGDLGDREKITQAYAVFSASASTIINAHAPR